MLAHTLEAVAHGRAVRAQGDAEPDARWRTCRRATWRATSRTRALRPHPGTGRCGTRRADELLDRPGDRLVVTGDHGNDPTIGHAYHTSEYVPVLVHRPEAPELEPLPDASSLADIGATAAASLGLDPAHLANGPRLRRTPDPA